MVGLLFEPVPPVVAMEGKHSQQNQVIVNRANWLEIVFEIFFTRKRFTFIYVITAFMVATRTSNNCTFPSHFIFDTLES